MRSKEFKKRADEKKKQLDREMQNEGGVGGKDMFAMLLSAFLVIFPIAVAVILALSFFMLWLFGAI